MLAREGQGRAAMMIRNDGVPSKGLGPGPHQSAVSWRPISLSLSDYQPWPPRVSCGARNLMKPGWLYRKALDTHAELPCVLPQVSLEWKLSRRTVRCYKEFRPLGPSRLR